MYVRVLWIYVLLEGGADFWIYAINLHVVKVTKETTYGLVWFC